MGRKLKPIDEAAVADLAYKGARNSEIAFILDVDDQTLVNRFSRLLDKKRAERRVRLRELQMDQAEQGNPTMLVWLGKNELEQTDKTIVEQQADGKLRIYVEYVDGGSRPIATAPAAPGAAADPPGDAAV